MALICGDQPVKILGYHLGPLTHHMMYEAEIIGVLLALQLIGKEQSGSMASVKLDNQAVIQALRSRQAKPGNSLLSLIHSHCNRLTATSRCHPISLCLDWILGHDGIGGNELVDAKAKKAASMDSSLTAMLPAKLRVPELPYSLTAVWNAYNLELIGQWKSRWALSHQHKRLDKIDTKLPASSYLKVIDSLSHQQASLLMQLHMGHIPLASYLHRIGKAEQPDCRLCSHGAEMVRHYLFECRAHDHTWHKLARKLGLKAKLLKHLLGNGWAFKALLKFIGESERFKSTYGIVILHDIQADSIGQGTWTLVSPIATRRTSLLRTHKTHFCPLSTSSPLRPQDGPPGSCSLLYVARNLIEQTQTTYSVGL